MLPGVVAAAAALLTVAAGASLASAQTDAPTPTTEPSTPPPSPTPNTASPAPQATPPPAPPPVRTEPTPRPPPEEEEGDGRSADVFWLEVGGGYAYADLIQFSQDNFIPGAQELKGSGFMGTIAAGFKIYIITIGARASLSSFSDFDLGTAVLDVALRLPVPLVEPYARVGFGYGWVGAANYTEPSNSDTSVFGLVGEAGAGVDIYLGEFVAIGAGFDLAFLNLTRQRVDEGCGGGNCMIETINFEESGDAVGFSLRAHAHASLHF